MTIKEIFKNKIEQKIILKGWIISNRGNKKIRFITINDGSTFENIQIVIKEKIEDLDSVGIGSAIEFEGKIKLTLNKKQSLELICKNFKILSNVDKDFPLQKQEMSREMLREIPHLRHRTNIFRAVMRIRSTLFQEIHSFFAKKNFLNMSAPIITSNDGEGAGETFVVDDESKDFFFNKKANLGVTGQLHAESYALGFGKVYTFAPTFRAENSHTTKHVAEFWMLEPEVAFSNMRDGVELADELIKKVIKNVLKKHPLEFEFLNENVEKDLFNKLNKLIDKKIEFFDYKDAIEKLKEVKDIFQNKKIKFGMDLDTEHERYIAEEIFKGPVALINYPKEIKAFYMYQNKDNKTVSAFDILVPGIGELVGGSQRETNIKKLKTRIKEIGLNEEDLKWYIDLRRFGDAMSTGFGLGFERLVMYVTGINNIRDSIPFPRTHKNLKM